ncbi:CPBP family intramembrane glutamic endopeptidase [Pseudoramibacter alactolyticus]|jgi:membrane protease YdiL (CAAX protease family)|uniref:CPBP family intramembrane glutamic endopeptidase n=1 Tax=Pseudoramibacter alactolyticus TaxID=113287 RepID=UPI0028E7C05A|nr:CPBP family intramembrane glutamic endopeptidase [Pseudoramibacter alactolyticus]MCI2206612.1 CPBP family intramembrane metalloprotease [Oscillospiraceae bacterium]
MALLLNKVLNSIIQIILFALIPFIWWYISGRKQEKFTQWIGLKKLNGKKKKIVGAVIVISVLFMILGAIILYNLKNVEMATSVFKGLGLCAFPAILVYAIFNTAFPEELFFRGFILKRASDKFGFICGNCIQAILFALLHGVMFISLVGMPKSILIVVFTGLIAYSMGYVNEKMANGSIIPSWIIHSLSNIFSGICMAFMLI